MLLQSERGSWKGGRLRNRRSSSSKILSATPSAKSSSILSTTRSLSSTSSTSDESNDISDDEKQMFIKTGTTVAGAKKEMACDSKVIYEGPEGYIISLYTHIGYPMIWFETKNLYYKLYNQLAVCLVQSNCAE